MFKVGDKISFGVRQNWLGRGTPSISRYTGTISIVVYEDRLTKPVIWVSSPEYSNKNIAFTKRKNGNWVMKGVQDDNFHGYSRVALQHDGKPSKRIIENQLECQE